jgi:hypothetical protein
MMRFRRRARHRIIWAWFFGESSAWLPKASDFEGLNYRLAHTEWAISHE